MSTCAVYTSQRRAVPRAEERQPSRLEHSLACPLGTAHRRDLLLSDHVPLWVLHVLGDGRIRLQHVQQFL